jgi:phytoene synthase
MTQLAEPSQIEQAAPYRLDEAAAAKAHVRAVVEASGTSFYWAMRLLPPARREAMFAVYAFCREVDDIADGEDPPAKRRQALTEWRAEIDRLYNGKPQRATAKALLPAVRTYNLPKAEFLAMLDGMEMDVAMDAQRELQPLTMEELLLYCRRVAGAVGVLSVHCFGAASPQAEELAVVEGEALQLTNILRDLAEDAERRRLYLPRELLADAGLIGLPPEALLDHPKLPAVCFALSDMAAARFVRARELLAACDRKALKPAAMMLEVYDRILTLLKQKAWRQPRQRVSLPRAQKLWLVLRYGLL